MALKATPIQVVIALGSNLGDRGDLIREGFDFLSHSFAEEGTFKSSSILETEPVDCPPGSPRFLNAVALFKTVHSVRSILEKCQAFEKEKGRPSIRETNAPRPLDLDLIAYGNEIYSDPDLQLPHPRATQRRFVLAPLVELMPELILPLQTKSVKVLLDELQD
ncbi:MAG: 2-amino-4-hydroxy-6-hydroxymethyldihydropteridine diphosphokinase [Verrucomicrobiota bacterium]